MKRRPGHASVEEHPKGSGLYRVRARVGNKRPVLGKNLSRVAAEELANAQAAVRNAQELREGITLKDLYELATALTDVQAAEELNEARAALFRRVPARTG